MTLFSFKAEELLREGLEIINNLKEENYAFDVTCQGSVPQALESFFEAKNFEDAIRNAVSIGGDSDTIACIAGSIAEALYGVPQAIREQVLSYLPEKFKALMNRFEEKFGIPL